MLLLSVFIHGSRVCEQVKINFLERSNGLRQRNRISPRLVYDVGTFNFAIQKLCTLQTSFCTITRYTIERNEIGGGHCRGARIRIWLLHFACDSYTMRSIGSCRLLLPLSDCGTSARLFPPFILCPDEKFRRIRIYLFGPMEKYESVFRRVPPRVPSRLAFTPRREIELVPFARNKH